MSKTAKGASAPSSEADLPFEQALEKLEESISAMEKDDLPLESLLARYEEGTRLAAVCQAKLAEADLKIKQLEKKSSGELSLKPLAADLQEPA